MVHDARRTHVAAGVPEESFGQFDVHFVGCAECLRAALGIGIRKGVFSAGERSRLG